MPELTPDEMSFFETGELPPGLADEAAAAAAAAAALITDPNVEDPKVEDPPQVDKAAELAAQLALEREQRLALENSLNEIKTTLAEKLKPAPAPAAEAPDPVTDPLGHMMHQIKTVNDNVAKLQTDLTTQQQQNLQRQQFDALQTAVRTARDTFEAATPDFKQAYAHIRNLRTEDLRAAGAPEKDIPTILMQDELQIAQAAISRGKNPAEEMYAMAKRYGYTPKVGAAAPVGKPAQNPEEKMDNLRNAQSAARAPGKAAADVALTLDGLKEASQADLNRLVQDDDAWARIVGGASGPDIFRH